MNLKSVGSSLGEQQPEVEAEVEVLDELDEYLKEPSPTDDGDFNQTGLLRWWHERRHRWPNLTRMARQFLACPATEAGVERMFSAAGKCHDASKKSTKETSIEAILGAAKNTLLPKI